VQSRLSAMGVSSGLIGWLGDDAAAVADVTEEFYCVLEKGPDMLPLRHSYLLVPGLCGDLLPGYFSDTLSRFSALGVKAAMSSIDSTAGVCENAAAVRRDVLDLHSATGKPVVIIGHSKGGLDAAAALALYEAEIVPCTRGLITVQSPYGGTPIASDLLADAAVSDWLEDAMRRYIRTDSQAVRDLTHESRRNFLEEHPLPASVPCVSFHSATDGGGSVCGATAAYINGRYGEESDGLVTRRDAEVPGSWVVRYREEMDHTVPVFPHGILSREANERSASRKWALAALRPAEPATSLVTTTIVHADYALRRTLRKASGIRGPELHVALVRLLLQLGP